MTKSHIWWRRSGVAGLGLALTLTTALTGINTASAAVPSDDDITVAPVVGALADSEENELGLISITEVVDNQFFPAGTTTTVTLTLSGGATFTDDVTPTFTSSGGYIINQDVDDDDVETDGDSATYTFTVTAPAAGGRANITVDGLLVDVPDTLGDSATITLTTSFSGSVFTDTDPALKILGQERIGGVNRYETAAKAWRESDTFFDQDPDDDTTFGGSVVLSGGEDYPDALSANYLAGALDTGILLTRRGFLPQETESAIVDSGIRTVYITGGTGAVSQAVEDQLEATDIGDAGPFSGKIQVIRLGGADRYATNRLINQYTNNVIGDSDDADTVLFASGRGFADALALGPVAYSQLYPLILVPGDSLGSSAEAQLEELNPDQAVIAGGTASVSADTEAEIDEEVDDVDRYGGADRTLTAAAVAEWADRNTVFGDDFNSSNVFLANGQGYADALVGGPLAGSGSEIGDDEGPEEGGNVAVILLAKNTTDLGAGTKNYLGNRTTDQVDTITALGLSGVVPRALLQDAANAVGVGTNTDADLLAPMP